MIRRLRNQTEIPSPQTERRKKLKITRRYLYMYRRFDSVVDNALACHHCDPGSNPGQGMWQGSGRPSRLGGFPRVLRFPPPRWTTLRQHPRLQERVYKFNELFV